jgi:hypothetical protein
VGTCGYGEELSSSINAENFLTSGKVYWLASQEGLCSMEYVSKGYCASSWCFISFYLQSVVLLSLVADPSFRAV